MKKIIAYILCVAAAFAMCWFGLLAVSTPYADPERKWYVAGLAVSAVIAIVCAAYGSSITWKDKE